MSALDPQQAAATPAGRVAALCVHIFTATGAALALLALLAAIAQRWSLMFVWLLIALAVDGLDGQLARRFRVKQAAPRWSGDILDLVVDILTYVFVPAYALIGAKVLPEPAAIPLACAILVTSVLYFADTHMKSADNYFMGFPAVWNLVAFFLFLWRLPPWGTATVVAGLCALTFVPVPFLHPLRVRRGRSLNVALLGLGVALGGLALAQDLAPGPFVTVPLSLIGLYLLVAGWLQRGA